MRKCGHRCRATLYYQHEETGYQVELPCSLGRGHSGECMPEFPPGPRYWPISPTAQDECKASEVAE